MNALLVASCTALLCAIGQPATGSSAPSSPLRVPGKGAAGFTLLSATETSVHFVNQLEEIDGARNRTLYNGSGVAAGDFDNDGLPDLYFCSLAGKNVLYRNLGGFRFEDVTAKAGVECLGVISRGAVFADLNADGRADLLVGTTGEGVLTFLNQGNGTFANATAEAGTASRFASLTLALADVDGDGDLDLYVCNNRREDFRDQPQVNLLRIDGKRTVPPFLQTRFVLDAAENILEYGEPDQLYLNDGKGKFSPVSWTDGAFLDEDGKALTAPPRDWGLTATFRDINQDGNPDLYVCNDYWTPDRIWLGDGKGGFRATPKLAFRSTCASSMGVDFADIDRDGDMDCFVVDMLSREHQRRNTQLAAMDLAPVEIGLIEDRPQIMRNTLHLNRGDGTFAETAYYSGLAASEWSWQPIFLDVDLDGLEDVIISTGHVRDVQDADTSNKIKELQSKGELVPPNPSRLTFSTDRREAFTAELLQMSRMRPRLATPMVAFRNIGNAQFKEAEKQWGTDQDAVHHGFITVDLDRDGDLDLVVNNLDSTAGIYGNNSSAARVAVRLKGGRGNPDGVGAVVRLIGGAVPEQQQEVISGGRYLSGGEPQLCFAAGKAKGGMKLEVIWRDGRRSVVEGVQPNHLYAIDQTTAEQPATPQPAAMQPLFVDASHLLNHKHHENDFDDFKRQSLLPNRLSQLGPGATWCDVNSDGLEDLAIGSGKGGAATLFLNDGSGGFTPATCGVLSQPAPRDQSALVAWRESSDRAALLIGLANFEDGGTEGKAAELFILGKEPTAAAELPDGTGSTGAMAVADVNGDGALDVFVAGRSVPGRFPEPASSRLFLRKGNGFALDEANASTFRDLGLVSSAVFSDVNGDAAPDLVLAIEWGPITVFLNDGNGRFTNMTRQLGLSKATGWWNGVTTGDLNGDGRLDIVATNWGRNSKYEHHYDDKHPLLVHWGEFNGDGVVQVVESHFDRHMNKLVPERGLSSSSKVMPFIHKVTPSYAAYAGAGLHDIYGERLKKAPSLSARTLEHKLFLNRGSRFEAVSLPLEAQLAPGFGVNVADVDGDGNEDLFLTQNFFASQVETPRIDAGLGLWLKGDGKGGLAPLSAQQSGVRVYGDARASALADYDGDGRLDLVVTQNGAATRLFHNAGAKPGLRVRLAGPEGNLTAIGAQLRVISGGRKGPVREIRAGSGYWSQDSCVQVVAAPEADAKVWIRWPGGKETVTDVPARAREITVAPTGPAVVAAHATR